METSMRFKSEERQLYLHAKENFVSDGNIVLQVHGRLNTQTGSPSAIIQLRKKFFPELLTNINVGARLDVGEGQSPEILYNVSSKKTIELTDNGLLALDFKAGIHYNANMKQGKPKGVVELSQKVFNFTDDQDLKIKLGYDVVNKRPYCQLRENNWTMNVDFKNNNIQNPSWSITYDL
eukprot:jgi/Mesen1/3793/ME000206S02975